MKKFEKKQRFSIRKYSFGAGSVLVGLCLSFTLHSTKVEAAETVTNVQTNIGHAANTGDKDEENSESTTNTTKDASVKSESETTNQTDTQTKSSTETTKSNSDVASKESNTADSNDYEDTNTSQSKQTDNQTKAVDKNTDETQTASAKDVDVTTKSSLNDGKQANDKNDNAVSEESINNDQNNEETKQNSTVNKNEQRETSTSTQHVNSTTSTETTTSTKANSSEESTSNVPSQNTNQELKDTNSKETVQSKTESSTNTNQPIITEKENNEALSKSSKDEKFNAPIPENATSTTKPVISTRSLKTLSVTRAMVLNAQAANNTTQVVNKNNFTDYFKVNKGASYDAATGIITLTPNVQSVQGNVALNNKIDMSQSFHLTGKINLGDKTGMHGGGDGIGFVFQPNNIEAQGVNGGALGIGGLKNAFGFKFDTWYNGEEDPVNFNPDPIGFKSNQNKVMGAFMSTNDKGKADTDASTVKYLPGPTNNQFNDVTIDYNGDTKVMTVSYKVGTTTTNFSKDLSSYIKQGTNYALSLSGSTGWAYNLQQFQLDQFSYTAKGVVNVRYVDNNGNPIPGVTTEERLGNINDVINTGNNLNNIQNNGYQLVSSTASNPSTFNNATNSVTVVTSPQTITYVFKDVKGPTVNAISSQTKEVNTAIDSIIINSTDNSGKSVTNSVSNLPDGVTFNSSTNTISGVSKNVGNYTVNVSSKDNEGNTTTTSFTITVKDTIAPAIDSISDQSISVNTPIKNITITGTDNSKQSFTNTVTGLPLGVTYNASTNTISGSPTKVGNYPIQVSSVDPSGNTTITKFVITVTDNIKPVITTINNQTKEVNTPIDTIKINATDNSGETLTTKVTGLPDGVTFDSTTNTITGNPTKVGIYNVNVTSEDSSKNTSTTVFSITVTDQTPPVIDKIGNQKKEINTPIDTIKINAKDNSGEPVTNSVNGLPKGVTFDPATNTISGTPTQVGTSTVTVTTTDAEGNSTETTFTIGVEDTTKPTVDKIDGQTKEVNTAIDPIEIHASDNSGQPVTNTVSGLPEGVTFDSATNTISGTPTTVGTYPVTVTTTDAEGNPTETTFTIKVEDTTKPTVESINGQTKEVNTAIDPIEIHATDNSGQPVKNTVSGLPEGVTFNPETNTISGTPTTVGTSTVTVTSDDGHGNKTETTFTIGVEDTTKPTVEAIGNQTKEVNTAIDPIEIHATDNSGQPVKNTVSGLPEGVTFDSATNTISGTPTTVGTSTVTVTSDDGQGNKTETTFTIKVEDTTKPTVEAIGNQTKEVNTAIDPIEIHATDNSGQPVTNTVSGLPEGVTFDPATNTISGKPTTVGTSTVTVTTTDAEGNPTETTFTIKVEDTTKPTVEAIGNQTKEVNTAIDPIEIHATDNSGQPVTNTVSGLPEGVTFDPATNTISGTPTTVGTSTVTVTSDDGHGNKTETTFTIGVEDTTKPTVDSIGDQTKEVNTAIDPIEIHASDNSGQPVTNTVSGLPEGVTFDSETNTISGTPTTVGTYPVTVTTRDEEGNTTETTFTIGVEDTTKPTVDSIGDQTKEVNTAIDPIEIHATDNSGQPVKNTVSGLPKGVTFDPETNTISGTPTTVGTYPVTVTTTDAEDNSTETTFTIVVEDTTKPTVDSIEDQTKEVNTAIDPIEIHAMDNSGQPVKNTVSGLPEGVTFDPATNTISGTPTQVGTSTVTVTTTDAEGNSTETTFTIGVEDTTKPTVDKIDGQTKEVNTAIDPIEIHASDNSGQPVTNTVSGLPEGVTFDSATNTISGTPTTVGTYPVTVTTTDAEGNPTETTFTIKVEDTTKPTVESINGQTKEVNTAIDPIEIHATDNSGQPVKNTVSGLPEGVTFNPETNTISGTPTTVGTSTVTVTSDDGHGNKTETTFTIGVEDTTKPTVEAIGNQTKEVNTAIDPIEIHATDNSGQPVKNTVSGLPEGVTFDSATNTISGTPTQVGTSTVTVTTTDGQGNTTETTFTIGVEDTTKPTVEAIGDQTKEVNTAIDPIEIHATDNSGQPVTNTVSGLPEGVTFDPATNTISGKPTTVGTSTVTVTSDDGHGNKTETTFTIGVEDTTKPTVESINDQAKEVNTAIDPIEIHATDNSGQPVKNTVSGLPEGVTFDPETNTISGTPTTVGTSTVTVTSDDGHGNKTETTFTIGVEDTTKPTVESINDQTKEVNTAIDPIEIHATDNSGQPVTNTVSGLPEGVTFDSETNTISGTPTTVGTYPVTVTTRDEEGNTTETTFTIKVEDTTKPTVDSIGDQTKEVNTAIDPIEIHATDNSGQPVKNTVSGLPKGVTFDPETNTISGTPTTVGTYPVTVTTTDAKGNTTETTFTIKVEDTTKPTVDKIDDQTKEVNTAIDPIEIHATDNSGQPVTNSVSGLPEGVTFDPETNTISGTPTTVGTYPVTVTTTDAEGNPTETTFTIGVEDTTKPTVEAIGDQTKEVNTAIDPIEIHAMDNSGQPVTNTVSGLPEGVTFDPETNTISGTPTTVGTSTVTVTSDDGHGNKTETTFTIGVEDTTKPTVEAIGNQTKEVNTAIDPIEIHATDNSGQPVKNTVSGLPEGVTFDSATNTISGTPTQVGTSTVTVTTTDGQGNTTETTFTIGVEDTTKPTVEAIGDQTKEVNTAIDPIEIHATDNSDQPVTNIVSGLPEGVTFDPETNTISGTPTIVGTYPVTVTTTDAEGNPTETTFTIKVEDTTKPTVDKIDDQTKEVNTAIDPIEIHATDNSGQPVTNTVSGLPEGVTFDPATNTISGIPTTVGTSTVTVTSDDGHGNKTETTFTIKVEDTTKPTVDKIDDQTKEVNTAIDPIEIHATDNSGQPVTNTVSGLPEGVTFDPATNTISGTPTTVGTYPVTVTTRDEEGNTTETTFTIGVEDTTKPTVEVIGNQTKEVNTAIDPIEIHATDNSGQPVTNTVSGLPEGVTFDPATNTISGTPTTVGTSTVTVTSDDGHGNKTETTFTIGVEDTTKPTVEAIGDQTKEVNTAIDPIEIHATDNSGQPVKNTVSGLPEGVTFDPETNTISGTPTQVGTYPVTVTTTDEEGNPTETTFTIGVEDTTKPTVESINDQIKEVNTAIDPIEIHATDNSGQPVKNTVSGLPEGVTFDPATNTISGTPTTVGTYPVTVTTTDAEGNPTETTFTITVEDTTKPTVDKIDDQTKEVNTAIDPIEIHATDNSGQPVTNTVSGLPEGVTFDPETNTISGTPTTVGTSTVTVTSDDGHGNKTETTFTIKVEDTTKPTVESINDQTKEVNTAIDPIEIHATDNSGQPVTNTVSGLPEGVTFDPETNTISGTPTTVGTSTVTVTSDDGHGNKTETTFTIGVEDTTKPTVDSIGDQTKEVNTAIDPIEIHATDNSGQPVKNTVSGLPEGVTFDPATNTISGTPTTVGTYPVTVTTTDAQGNPTETTFTIGVEDTTKPTVDSIGDQTKEVNTAIDPIEIHATDNSGQPVKNTVSGLPEGVTFDSATNTISGTPTTVGTYPVTVTTRDEEGNTTETTFTIKVEDTTKPTVETIGNQTKEVNTAIDPIEIHATDNSGQPVKNTVSGLPEGVTFDPATNTISGTPTTVGTYPVTVTTTDAQGNPTETTFTIGVEDTTTPTVESINDQIKEVNTAIDPIEIHATDNSGQPVKNTVSGLPEGVTFDPATNTISGTPTTVGTYPVTVTTTDAEGNPTETTFTIGVEDTTKPTVEAIGDQTKEVNTAIDPIEIHATDNSGQPVTNTVSGLPEGVTFDSETNTISGTPTTVGTYPVTVTTRDEEGNTTETTFTIGVEDTTKPTVETIGNQTKEVNTAIDPIEIHATDNSGQPVTNTVSGLPEGVTFDPATNTISGIPTTVGTSTVTVTTTDAEGNSTETTFTIGVEDTTKPTVESINGQTKEVNTAIDPIEIHATDNSGQPVTNSVSGLPKGVTFDPETNTISGTPTTVGTYPVTVTTTDEQGNTTKTTFTIIVKDTTAPKVDVIPDQTKHVNTPIDPIEIHATDNSGQPVKNTVSGLPKGVTFDPATNIISGTPTKAGVYHVTITTIDSQGNKTETTFIITVVESGGNQTPSNSHPASDHGEGTPKKQPVKSNNDIKDNENHKSQITASQDMNHQQSNNQEATDTNEHSNHLSFDATNNSQHNNYSNDSSQETNMKDENRFNSNTINNSGNTSYVKQDDEQDIAKALNRKQVLTDNKKDKVDVLPDTGETDPKNSTLFAGIFAALGSLFILGRRRRKKDNK